MVLEQRGAFKLRKVSHETFANFHFSELARVVEHR
jgi:hypothetical protein